MPVSRKRKAALVEHAPAPKQTRSTKTQKCISAFGSVAKPHGQDVEAKKRKMVHTREATPPPPAAAAAAEADRKRKRKRSANVSDDEEIVVGPRRGAARDSREPDQSSVLSTPRNKRVKNMIPSPLETPTRGAAALFNRLDIASNTRSIPIALGGPLNAYDTPPESPGNDDSTDLSILAELADLRHLYSSFLAALSMHYSHNGTTTPVDVSALLEMVTRHYKKRDVKLEDLQRILTIASRLDQSFCLEHYGRAGVRLTRAEPRVGAEKQASSYVDEAKLNARFGDALRQSWKSWEACTAKENRDSAAFLNHLPLLPITKNASAEQAAPIFARGEQRLADIKASQAAAAKIESSKPTQHEAIAQRSAQATQNRGTALLDRILAKQSMASTLPAGPTKSQLERKSALHRIEEIARILSLLASSKERCSFSMQVVTQQLQQSLRNPISREEVERCLELMSREIVPAFLKVVHSGEVKAITITKNGSVALDELRERVQRACA